MTTKTRNEYIALAVILIVLGYVLYANFFSSPSKPSSTASLSIPAVEPGATAATGTAAVAGSASPASPAATTAFLPNGASFDADVLKSSLFSALVAPQSYSVSADDVGVQDPFSPGQPLNQSTPNSSIQNSTAAPSTARGQ